jgi:cytosine/adenosine deaminase-related metal-dependent hydrolase
VTSAGLRGRFVPGADADVVALDPRTLEPVFVIARGRVVLRDRVDVQPNFLQDSTREVTLRGSKA